MVKQDDWPLKVRATHGISDYFFWGTGGDGVLPHSTTNPLVIGRLML
jgi:hypothetical protein